MKSAKELADILREFCVIESEDDGVAIIAHLDRLAAIDSAGLGVVGEIAARCAAGLAGENILQAVHDIKTLLAIVQRQAGENMALRAQIPYFEECRRQQGELAIKAEAERDESRAEVARLTDRLRIMQHGEAEALKMMAAEKQRADGLAVEVRAWKASHATAVQQLISAETELRGLYEEPDMEPAPVIRRLRAETSATILKLRAEATEQRELAEKEREFGNVAHANGQRLQRLVDVLSSGIAAYRSGSFTLPQVWENGEGKAVPR